MDRVHHAGQSPYQAIRNLAIAIAETGVDQRHAGILHRESPNGPVMMLDLQWHHKLCNEAVIGEKYFWVDPSLPARRLAQIGDVCRKVWRSNGTNAIPYGFSPPTDCFDKQTSQYLVGPSRHGLTCSSFVVAVFARAGVPLVRCDQWPAGRPGDKEWQKKIVEALRCTGAGSAHVDAVESEIGTVRFRPEEVAAAATLNPLPAGFKESERLGRNLLARLRGDLSSTPTPVVRPRSSIRSVIARLLQWFRQ